MGFLKPKIPDSAPPAPNPATPAMDPLGAGAPLGDSGVYGPHILLSIPRRAD
jgi:hypothetical protein